MLKMECPKCKGWIYSKLLRESNDVFCDNCNTDVPVTDVYVSARGYTVLKDILNDRSYRYEKLLREAEKELDVISKKTINRCDESTSSIKGLILALKELLEGARNNIRVRPPDVAVEYEFENHKQVGKMVNLSVTGTCIGIEESGRLPQIKREINLNFFLPGVEKQFSIKGKVAWVKSGISGRDFKTGIGVRFEEHYGEIRSLLWEFITIQNMEARIVDGK